MDNNGIKTLSLIIIIAVLFGGILLSIHLLIILSIIIIITLFNFFFFHYDGIKAQKMMSEGKYFSAIHIYKKIVHKNKNNATAYYNMGLAQSEFGEYNNAIDSFGKAISITTKYNTKMNNVYNDAYYARGIAYAKIAKYNEALQDFEYLIQSDKNYYNAYAYKGIILELQKKYDEAIKTYASMFDINNGILSHYLNGILLNYLQYPIGESNQIIIKTDNNYSLAHLNKGILLLMINHIDESIVEFNKSIEINNNLEDAYNYKIQCLNKKAQYKKIISICNARINYHIKANKIISHVNYFFIKGIFLKILEKYNEAIATFTEEQEYRKNKKSPLFNNKESKKQIAECVSLLNISKNL